MANTTQATLIEMGFKKDETAPYVNRYELSDGETHFDSTYWISVTMSEDGSECEYGVILFYDSIGDVCKKRKWCGALSVEDLKAIMDKNSIAPMFVKEFPMFNL